ncbi:MAG: ParB/RepB/Spo0J family partition protein [Gammaproteobacteria bacterium]|jgi:ParB family chromosome partitioning protein|nr:ParB/RepB/Spo0J family partition protein [Gammaproteobacteria bacterium]
MNQKKPVLGRGLDALLGQMSASRASTGAPALPGDELAKLPLDQLQRGRYQPRVDMREEALEDLASSIRAQGVVQPIVVRPIEMPGAAPGAAPTRYEIIAGERRWRAAQMAGLETIPAVIRRVPDESAIAMALIENIQRENLNPLEEARALDRLIREFEVTHQQAADAVGRSRAAVSNLLRLLELPAEVAELVDRRQIEMGHARALLGLTQKRQQVEVGQLVSKKGLSVRETEALVRRLNNPPKKDDGLDRDFGSGSLGEAKDANVRELENRLSETLGADVKIESIGKGGKGRLVIAYHSLDELDGILSHIH